VLDHASAHLLQSLQIGGGVVVHERRTECGELIKQGASTGPTMIFRIKKLNKKITNKPALTAAANFRRRVHAVAVTRKVGYS
jgi:hypothetical protein